MLAAAPPRNAPPRSRPTPLPTTNQCTRAAACHTPRPSRGKAGGLRNQRALDQQQKHARTRLQASPAHTRHACLPPHPHTACPAYASAPHERCMVRADPQGVRHPLTLRFRHLWHERVKTGKVRRGAAAHRRRAPGGRRGGGCGTVALHGAARPPPAAWRPRPGPRHRQCAQRKAAPVPAASHASSRRRRSQTQCCADGRRLPRGCAAAPLAPAQ